MSKHIDKSIFPQNPKVGDEFAVHGTPESVPPGWKASGGWINSEAIGLVYRYEGVQQAECSGPCSCTITERLFNEIRTLEALRDEQAEVIEAQAGEIATLRGSVEAKQRIINQKCKEIAILREHITSTPTCLMQAGDIHHEDQERIKALEQEREGLHEQISGLKHELVKVVDKLGREQDALDRSSQVVQAHYSVIQSLNKVIAERDQEIEDLQDDLESTSEIDDAKIESLQGQIRKRDEIIVGLRQALANSSKKRWRLFGPGTGLGGGR